jgi:hypothetical protein
MVMAAQPYVVAMLVPAALMMPSNAQVHRQTAILLAGRSRPTFFNHAGDDDPQ